ncbi:hypothetical protein GCM10011504_25330 [Siccirubricoccus deserti]|uniref:Uncharacterized protein n=1 Tax=Siccirubricoccus deserti TaxID=2013562 RepID=A0A9X0QZI6_9PROT|nr:hypothetical protein [Siccirubricoccus deserti]MBC4016133.1 hypothetical protein [Siccirubricoccus deserti]GGC45788.1 hypothetical protein GCM10011504_25330 [Siccirubricoccus deserti]
MDRRPDPWGDFLRRTLLAVGLAGAAAVPPALATDPPAAEQGERETIPNQAPPQAEGQE